MSIQSIYAAGEAYKTASKLLGRIMGEKFMKFNGENYTDNENLLLAVGPVISAAVVRVHTVDELIKLYEKHKVLKAKIPRFHFLNYNMGENFEKVL